jgi:hypothetical protein
MVLIILFNKFGFNAFYKIPKGFHVYSNNASIILFNPEGVAGKSRAIPATNV